MSSAAVIEVDMKSGSEHKDGGKPEVATRLQEEGAKLKEKRQSLTKEEVASKLQHAEHNRQQILDQKVSTAKELEGHVSPKK